MPSSGMALPVRSMDRRRSLGAVRSCTTSVAPGSPMLHPPRSRVRSLMAGARPRPLARRAAPESEMCVLRRVSLRHRSDGLAPRAARPHAPLSHTLLLLRSSTTCCSVRLRPNPSARRAAPLDSMLLRASPRVTSTSCGHWAHTLPSASAPASDTTLYSRSRLRQRRLREGMHSSSALTPASQISFPAQSRLRRSSAGPAPSRARAAPPTWVILLPQRSSLRAASAGSAARPDRARAPQSRMSVAVRPRVRVCSCLAF
mmetsp:Transcript_71119/g.118941  ORF Transcript_71119/g.118941 Transcript_71119/m.118941 type:complete len:258 (+) Transcript_71119:1564-2337(+)